MPSHNQKSNDHVTRASHSKSSRVRRRSRRNLGQESIARVNRRTTYSRSFKTIMQMGERHLESAEGIRRYFVEKLAFAKQMIEHPDERRPRYWLKTYIRCKAKNAVIDLMLSDDIQHMIGAALKQNGLSATPSPEHVSVSEVDAPP